MKRNTAFKSKLYSLSRFDPKRIFKQDILIIWKKEVLNTKWRETQFSTANCVLSANLMQNAFIRKVSLKFEKRIFLTQNDVEHTFQQRVVFFEQIWCKRHFWGRNYYPLEKGSFQHKMKWNTVFNTELSFGKRKFWTQIEA